jgi:hypothetical protein
MKTTDPSPAPRKTSTTRPALRRSRTTSTTPTAPTRRRKVAAPDVGSIAERAFQLFAARGWQHGRDLDDWLQAETELKSPTAARKRASRK